MVDAFPAFFLGAGNLLFENEDPIGLVQARYIYRTEDEYRHVIQYLRRKGAIDEKGNRLTGNVPPTEHPTNEDF